MSQSTETKKFQASNLNLKDQSQMTDVINNIVTWTNAIVSQFDSLSPDDQKNVNASGYQFAKDIQQLYPRYASALDLQTVSSNSGDRRSNK